MENQEYTGIQKANRVPAVQTTDYFGHQVTYVIYILYLMIYD